MKFDLKSWYETLSNKKYIKNIIKKNKYMKLNKYESK